MLCTFLGLCHFIINLAFPHLASNQKIPCNSQMLCTFLGLCHFIINLAFPHLASSQKIPCDSQKSIETENMSANRERTFIMLKPDAVHRGLIGDIIKRFEQKGFKLVAMK